jgi:hypothetical protein
MCQEPLLAFREYHLSYQVEELLDTPSCTIDLSLLLPIVENNCTSKTSIYSIVALAGFDFVARDLY